MANFFRPAKDGTVLHLTKSGRWEKCTIPVGCTRHVDLSKLSSAEILKLEKDSIWSEESANEQAGASLSVEDYNGYDPEADYDEFDDMKIIVNPALIAQHNAYELKRVNYHYACPECKIPFESVKTVEAMDKQVSLHDCENLTDLEAYKKRKLIKADMGVYQFGEKVKFEGEHKDCKSYQTACADCAEKHELKLYEFYTRHELSQIVRNDSMFVDHERRQRVGDDGEYFSSEYMGGISDIPEFEKWQYLPNKSQTQLDLEREGLNYGNHLNDEDECRVCGQHVYDMYCMDCWSAAGYLLED